jgi:hypothetical protein
MFNPKRKEMKSVFKYFFPGLLILFSVTSCFNDLEPKSLGPNSLNSATVYNTTADFKSGLAKVYTSFSLSGQQGPAGNPDIINVDEGFATYLRMFFNVQELPTDEAVYSWAEDGNIRPLHYQTWTPTNTFTQMMYTRILLAVTYANEFIRASAASSDPEVARFAAEARYLRALAYYHALDLFGRPSFVTEEDLPGAFFPEQIERTDLFTYIESELTDIEGLLGEPKFEYGRADKAAVWMLQAKMYLNAEVYTGTARYTDCVTAVNKVIASGAYSLAPNYLANFRADNDTSPEMIFAFNYDARRSQSYGGMDYIIHGSICGSMQPGDFGVSSGWSQNRVTPEFADKFPDPSGATDRRALFYTDGQSKTINDVAVPTDGWGVTKFKNITLAGGAAPSGGSPDFVDTDFPIFRLADAYLMYAEAVLRGGSGGSPSQALTYVNNIRTRAFNGAGGNISQGQLTLQFILDERGRELYWECTRRTDLVRYDQLTGGSYLWQWKGNDKDGVPTPSYRDVFPIPAREITGNPNLTQNTGY